jgi:translocation and assembly module TamB
LISAGMNQGDVDFSWKGESLQGNLSLSLETYGSLQGNFRLPIPAKIPFQVDPNGNIRAVLRGQTQENGLLSAIFPGTIQESRGNLDLDLQLDGTWKNPNPKGAIHLTNAGAFLPGLGIRVEDLTTRCRLQNEQIQIESFQAKSGPGRIEGSGNLRLKDWKIQSYDGNILGEKFQTFFLPELRIQSSPKLNFTGDSKGLSIRGEVLLPEVLVQGVSTSGTVRPSSDIVIVDQPTLQTSPFPLDMQVRIVLGERVTVKAEGVDARLAGTLDLQGTSVRSEQITARGEIRVVEGTYTGYGFNLRIDRGRFIFSGSPVDNPALDILALRRAEDLESGYDVKVGITILGTLKRPNIKLYSSPAMKDEDILSYIVTGRPYDRQSANLSFLWMGAGALLSGESSGSLDQLKKKMGIDKVDIESKSGDVSRSMITVGKYLTPQLYISYGYSIFDSEQALKLRYRFSKRWEVEAVRGSVGTMGMDLYYRIEFF